jgi:hypothetical protein
LYSSILTKKNRVFIRRKFYKFQFGVSLTEDYDGNGPSAVIDAGANIGLFTLYCLHRFPSLNMQVYAIEPIELIYNVLYRNTADFRNSKDVQGSRSVKISTHMLDLGKENGGKILFY